jgi:hypothetical protein
MLHYLLSLHKMSVAYILRHVGVLYGHSWSIAVQHSGWDCRTYMNLLRKQTVERSKDMCLTNTPSIKTLTCSDIQGGTEAAGLK